MKTLCSFVILSFVIGLSLFAGSNGGMMPSISPSLRSAASGGNGTFSLVNSNFFDNNGSDTTVATTVTGVHAGDLVYAFVSGFGTATITLSDGTTSFTGLTALTSGNTSFTSRGFYLLSSVASGSVTYTATYSTGTLGRGISVYVFTPSAAASLDQNTSAETIATTAGNSGNVTTTGTKAMLHFGAEVNENQSTISSPLINGVAADGIIGNASGGNTAVWWKTNFTTFTGAASETVGSSTRTLTHIVSFKL